MKKLIFIICTVLSLTLLCVCACAALPAVADNADLLTPDEESKLSQEAEKLRERGFDVVMLTMTGGYDGKGVVAYADDYFDYNGYGIGSDRTGVLLLINMTERDIYVSTSGKAIRALTDYGIDRLLDEITPYFSDAEYARGFERFLEEMDYYVSAYENGTPVSVEASADYFTAAIVCLVIGAVIALLITSSIKKGMNTTRISRDAAYAVDRESFELSRSRDIFLYSRTRRIPRNDSSSGSSTHRSSSGSSHGGGGRKF